MNRVKQYYEHHIYQEDKRLEYNIFEIPVTFRYIEKYLKAGDKILDIACGTGNYAEKLLSKGYLLGLNDLSEKNMELTLKRTGDHPNLIHSSVSDALDADIWGKEIWDAVLILGPLYHLTDVRSRLRLLEMAGNYVRTGGYIYLAFMSRTAALKYGLKNNPEGISKPGGARKLWRKGTDDNFVEGTEWFTNSYFSFPEEIRPLVTAAGLDLLHLVKMFRE